MIQIEQIQFTNLNPNLLITLIQKTISIWKKILLFQLKMLLSLHRIENRELNVNRKVNSEQSLGALSPDPPGQLDVLGHDGDPLSVDGTQVGILEETNEVSLRSFLESKDGGRLESKL